MKDIQAYLTEKQKQFGEHSFFKRLENNDPFDSAMAFVPGLTFWVLTFQDILRINHSKVLDPKLRKIARHHRFEDAGHEKWFLEDANQLEGRDRDLRWLFSPHHEQTRDAAYALMSEVFRTTDDRLRIVLLLTIESGGHLFFERICKYIECSGYARPLKYFARSHLDVEQGHHIYEERMQAEFFTLGIPAEVRDEAIAMIDRIYSSFSAMFDGLEARIIRRAAGAYSLMPPRDELAVLVNKA